MKTIVVTLVLFFSGVFYAAELWREPADFRGFKWGRPFSEAKQFFPTLYYTFPMTSLGPIEMYVTKPQEISDILVVDFTLGFMKNEFSYAKMDFRADDFEKVRDIFIVRYGKPHTTEKNTLKNALGSTFVNSTLRWTGSTIAIELNKYESTTHGSAQIGKLTFAREYERAQKNQAKEAAKGF